MRLLSADGIITNPLPRTRSIQNIALKSVDKTDVETMDEEVVPRKHSHLATCRGMFLPGAESFNRSVCVLECAIRRDGTGKRLFDAIFVCINHLEIRSKHRTEKFHCFGIIEQLLGSTTKLSDLRYE